MLKCPAPGGARFQQKGVPIIPGGIFFSTKILIWKEISMASPFPGQTVKTQAAQAVNT
jgi:hypothetical protein